MNNFNYRKGEDVCSLVLGCSMAFDEKLNIATLSFGNGSTKLADVLPAAFHAKSLLKTEFGFTAKIETFPTCAFIDVPEDVLTQITSKYWESVVAQMCA